jgi:hypothetical protein
MIPELFIPLQRLSQHYEVEITFFGELHEFGLIEIATVEQDQFLHQDDLGRLEKVIRLHRDLSMNLEGIDVVMHLLARIEELQSELHRAHRRLRFYGDIG